MIHPEIFYFVQKKCTPQWLLRPAVIDFWDLTFVLAGNAEYRSGQKVLPVRAGQAVLLPPNSLRSARTSGMTCAAFSFRTASPPSWDSQVLNWDYDDRILCLLREFERSWFSLDPDCELYCCGIFLLILHRLLELERKVKTNPYVLRIRQYLENHFLEPVTVAMVAQEMGLHPAYCGSLFKKETGSTILQTVNRLRISRAIELLCTDDMTVTEVALSCGYTDLYYFSRTFKNITGFSPTQFIRENEKALSVRAFFPEMKNQIFPR